MTNKIFDLLKDTYTGWSQSGAALHAAALAYYTIFSLAPLIAISVTMASSIFTQARVERELLSLAEEIAGAEVAALVQDVLESSQNVTSSSVLTGLSILVTVYGASTVFLQLGDSLNAMWGIVPKAAFVRQSIMIGLKSRLLSAAAVLTVGALLLASLLLNTLWTAIPEEILKQFVSNFDDWRPWLQFLASPVLFTLIFGLTFKMLPKATIRWRDVWPGAAVTALLFWLGGYAIGLYLGSLVTTSLYGAAGSIVLFLLWVYYSAQIVLFGAKLTQVYADRFGTPILPDKDALFVSRAPL